MTWFESLTGIPEQSAKQVQEQLMLDGEYLHSRATGKRWRYGQLAMPTLAELRTQAAACRLPTGHLQVSEIVANVQHLHADAAQANALFQVASQFNLLEMAAPEITPEAGIGIYEHDHTQGPSCAIAAGAGTIYRNYFVPVGGQTGQSASVQLDCLADLGAALGNHDNRLWRMQNGYVMPTAAGLAEVAGQLASGQARDAMRALLRIGIQWQTEVTLPGAHHNVSQAYCSALPVAYCRHPSALWQPFATLVLEAAYEATLHCGVINAARHGSRQVFLTLLGGGVFGNEPEWILAALARALDQFRDVPLEVAMVSYGRANPALSRMLSA